MLYTYIYTPRFVSTYSCQTRLGVPSDLYTSLASRFKDAEDALNQVNAVSAGTPTEELAAWPRRRLTEMQKVRVNILWMVAKSIPQHFEIMVEAIVSWSLRGSYHYMVFRWCRISSIHSRCPYWLIWLKNRGRFLVYLVVQSTIGAISFPEKDTCPPRRFPQLRKPGCPH